MHGNTAIDAHMLRLLPPTLLATAEQVVIQESLSRALDFPDFLQLCDYVEEGIDIRRKALRQLETCKFRDEAELSFFIARHASTDERHGSVYLLYLLGAYAEAGTLLDDHVESTTPHLYQPLAHARDRPHTAQAAHEIVSIVQSLYAGQANFASSTLRIKSPGSLATKTLAIALQRPFTTLAERLSIDATRLPYDFIGCRVALRTIDPQRFRLEYERLLAAFRARDVQLKQHRLYSMSEFHGASVIGTLAIAGDDLPFQVQIWSAHAERFEWMSHGNYKVHRRLCPLLPQWSTLCASDINRVDYARRIRDRITAGGD